MLTIVISNEAPGFLVDHLIAQGHGNETLFEVLGYLKPLSNGIISDTFYNQVAAAPPGSEAFTATLDNYARLVGGIEICSDGTLYIPSLLASEYVGAPGYGIASGLDGQSTFTFAQDAAHYIFSHGMNGGSITRLYYAFAIVWRGGDYVYLPMVAK